MHDRDDIPQINFNLKEYLMIEAFFVILEFIEIFIPATFLLFKYLVYEFQRLIKYVFIKIP